MTNAVSTPVRTYLDTRLRLHSEVCKHHLLGSAAEVAGDQVTLRADVTAGSDTFKAGSTYSLNPYEDRNRCAERLSLQGPQGSLEISHEYEPGFFSTRESLEIRAGGGFQFTSSSQDSTRTGVRPNGWMQNQLENEGYILNCSQ